MQYSDLQKQLEISLVKNDQSSITSLVTQESLKDLKVEHAEKIIEQLRSANQHILVEEFGNRCRYSGLDSPSIVRHQIRAQLDQGKIEKAASNCKDFLRNFDKDSSDLSENLGLSGRIKKQLYIENGDNRHLIESIQDYKQGASLSTGDPDWHKVNVLALENLAIQNEIQVNFSDSALLHRKSLLNKIEENDNLAPWDYANALEASMIDFSPNISNKLAAAYFNHPDTDAFMLNGTLRQLREVWKIDRLPWGIQLGTVFEFEILQRPGGIIVISPDKGLQNTSGFQGVYGEESYVKILWVEQLLSKISAIGLVIRKSDKKGVGTGFLLAGESLSDKLDGELVFITNSHVISSEKVDEAAAQPDNFIVELSRCTPPIKFETNETLFYSARDELDVYMCKVPDLDQKVIPLKASYHRPLLPKTETEKSQRLYVIGHPDGGDIVVSLYDNELISYPEPFVHYKSPTNPGSSGSPVMTRDLRTIAIHHRTHKSITANEGTLLEFVRNGLDSFLD